MAEWHVTPDYIVNNWTNELLDLMVKKLNERWERQSQARKNPRESGEEREFTEQPFFGNTDFIKVVKN